MISDKKNSISLVMKLFLDSASLEEIQQAEDLGLLDGVTTNPSLVAKIGKKHEELIAEICRFLKDRPVSAEVLSIHAEEMYQEGLALSQIHPQVTVKVPLTAEGIKALKKLKRKGISTNVTLCFSPNQALLAAKAGASFISVFIGRLDDVGHNGVEVALNCHRILKNYPHLTSKVLGASIRHPGHILDSALGGLEIGTLPFKVLSLLPKHPLTDLGLKQFLEAAGKKL